MVALVEKGAGCGDQKAFLQLLGRDTLPLFYYRRD